MPKCVFILKSNHNYGYSTYGNTKSSGLRNSATFVSDMLNEAGIPSAVELVNDNNDIDRIVTEHKPTHVFIEALWVVPEKFKILHKLHPHVKWIIRIHSEMPFLALEGIAIQWIKEYVRMRNVFVAANSRRAQSDLETATGADILYLPNFYPTDFERFQSSDSCFLNISAFGAIRPMKSQLSQAIAAIQFARELGMPLRFHINGTRIEHGDPVLKNLRALFAGERHVHLVEHNWLNHEHFVKVIRQMDIAMSVSLTETFSIVTADAVSQGVPIVTSPEVSWASKKSMARATDVQDIVSKMYDNFNDKHIVKQNQKLLKRYSRESRRDWLNYLEPKENLCSRLFSFLAL